MRLLFAVLASVFVLAAPAHAAGPELGIADDRLLLAGGPDADKAVLEWQQNGIQTVRIYALWSRIAPNSPTGSYEWAQLDHAVARVTAAGLKPILTVTGPGPLWVSRRSERGEPRYDPDPKLFGEFASLVAGRYGSQVDRYIIWNEPNLGGWIRPQAACFGKVCNSVAPHLYRDLVAAAYPAIHAADSKAQVLIGAMSSRGSRLTTENSNHRPLAFLRALGCVDAKFKKLRTGRCKNFKAPRADGFAFHPHGVLAAPEKVFPNKDDVSIASLSRLTSVPQARPLPGRVRLPDQPARQVHGDHVVPAGPVAAARRLPGVAQQAREAVLPVPVGRRAALAQQRDRRLAVRRAVHRRAREAEPEALRDAVRARRLPRTAVGSGAHARDAHCHRAETARGLVEVAEDRHPPDRLLRLLELDDAAHGRRVVPLPGRGCDERGLEAQVGLRAR
jgi:hypothetical protein